MENNLFWDEIKEHQGEKFYTTRGSEFVYEVVGDNLYVYVNGKFVKRVITRNNFLKAFTLPSLHSSQFSNTIIGSSYVRSIIETLDL